MQKMRLGFHARAAAIAACLALAVAAAPGSALAQQQSQTSDSKPGIAVVQTRTLTATVDAIDYKTRMVTLVQKDGGSLTFKVADRFPNLDKVQKGDIVKATYYESAVILVRKPDGQPTTETTEAVQVAQRGHKPESTVVRAVTSVATVTDIDYKKRMVTLKRSDGTSKTIHVGPDVKRLNDVKKGDQVVVEITEALAVSVQKATTKTN